MSEYNFKNVPLDDQRVWSLYKNGNVKGLFQVEGPLGIQWCKRIKPSNMDELSAILSLVRPGGIESGMLEKYCNIKNKKEEPSYIHESLKPILEKTYSCLVYQEQILEICMKIAGFTEIEADQARRAVGKKLPEEMIKVEKMFLDGCTKVGIVNENIAKEIFGWIQKSVRYLFNAGHSFSYAYTSYFQAFQKCYYPTEFFTAALDYSDEKLDPKQEIYELVHDAKLHNISVLNPNIQTKNVGFEIVKDRQIAFGLGHIKGVGDGSIGRIKDIKCETFLDFFLGIPKIKRSIAESFIKAGACDCYGIERLQMLNFVQCIYGRGKIKGMHHEVNDEYKPLTELELRHFRKNLSDLGFQGALQSIINEEECVKKRVPVIEKKIEHLKKEFKDTNKIKAIWEKIYLGLNLSCSAKDDLDSYEPGLMQCKNVIFTKPKDKIKILGTIDDVEIRRTGPKAKVPGQEYCYLTINDNSYAIQNIVCWPNLYEELKGDLLVDSVVVMDGKKDSWNGREQIVANKIRVIG